MTRTLLRRLITFGFCCLPMLAIVLSANAAEVTAEFSAGIGVSDNIARTADSEIDETTALLGVLLSISQESRRVDSSLRANFDYVNYLDDTFNEEVVGGLVAFADFKLAEERVSWIIEDTFGQQLFDPLSPARPDNREDVNYFETGPNINFLPGSRNNIGINLRYASVNYEERDVDNERLSATLTIGRDIRRGTTLSLVGSTTSVEFDNGGLSSDFDRQEAFMRYEVAGNKNTIGLDIGYTEIDIEGETSDGFLARLDWTRTVSANGEFRISGGTRYSDQGDVFRFNQDAASDFRDTVDVLGSTDPFIYNFFDVTYALETGRNTVRASGGWSEEDYNGGLALDREITRAEISFSREMTRSLSGGLSLRYHSRDFRNLSDKDDDFSVAADINYRFGPALGLSLQLQHATRGSDTPAGEFDENRAFLRLKYTPGWAR